jgi:hypothetical protein
MAVVLIATLVLTARKGPLQFTLTLLVSGSVGLINAWFLFLMCNRSIGNKEGFGWKTNLAKGVLASKGIYI